MAGLATSLIVGSAIAAGGGVASAKIASGAAKDAAEAQGASADKAMLLAQQQMEQQRADTAPWRNAGGQAVTALSGLMGLPSGPPPGPTGVPSNIGPPPGAIPNEHGVGFGILKPGVTPEQAADPGFQYQGPSVGQTSSLASLAPPSAPTPPTLAPGVQQTQSGYVTMRAPNGSMRPVPAAQVSHYEQLGAVRV